MKKRIFQAFIFIGIAAQFGVLTSNIVLHEITVRRGTVHRFQTAPIDPFDAFRGRYVALIFKEFTKEIQSDVDIPEDKWCYLQIGTDSEGFSVIKHISQKNDAQSPYLKARVRYSHPELACEEKAGSEGKSYCTQTGKHYIYFYSPFNRYYMPERLAPQAEEAYRQASRVGKRNAAAVVRIWNGRAVVEDLEIDGIPIREFLMMNVDIEP